MASWVLRNGTDDESRVGRRRVTDPMPALFRRPPSEPGVRHFDAPGSPVADRRTKVRLAVGKLWAVCISHPSLAPCRSHLCPFALWPAFPAALVGRDPYDYYGHSVALGLAPGRPSRVPSVADVRARRRCPVRPLEWTRCPSSTRRKVPTSATLTPYPGGPAPDALQGMCARITGAWGSGGLPFPVSRGPREPRPYASSDRSRFPTMLRSPLAFAAR